MFRPDKSAAVARDPDKLTAVQKEALRALKIPLCDGILVVGIPVGSSAFIQATLDEVVAEIRAKAESIVQTGKASPNTGQALFTSACLGIASMFTHLMRSLPPPVVEKHAREVDTIAVECVRRVLRLEHIDLEKEEGREFRERLFLCKGGMGMMSCARTADAAYVGHWALVGPAVQKMLPHTAIADMRTITSTPVLKELKAAADRIAGEVTDAGIKGEVLNLPQMLSNSSRGKQGEISTYLGELALKRFVSNLPVDTVRQRERKRAFISGMAPEAVAGIHASRSSLLCQLTDDEHRVTCAHRLGVDAFPPRQVARKCPDCHQPFADLTAHALSCSSKEAQGQRTRLHTAIDIAARAIIRDLNPECHVTAARDAYPVDHGFAASEDKFLNHHADAYVYDAGAGIGFLIDFTFTNAAKSGGKDGAEPGGHADLEEARKYAQYSTQFPGFCADSSPALVIVSMERHGSWSKGTIDFWEALLHSAHTRQKASEFPVHLSVMKRWVFQTLAVALRRVNASHILQFRRRVLESTRAGGR